MFQIKKTSKFIKRSAKFFKKHQSLLIKFNKIVNKLEQNPFLPSLRAHKLKSKLKDYYAISLTYEYRVVIDIIIIDDIVYLIDIGTHDEVYE